MVQGNEASESNCDSHFKTLRIIFDLERMFLKKLNLLTENCKTLRWIRECLRDLPDIESEAFRGLFQDVVCDVEWVVIVREIRKLPNVIPYMIVAFVTKSRKRVQKSLYPIFDAQLEWRSSAPVINSHIE